MKKSWFTYIIRCADGSLYTGSTNHVIRRWYQHREGRGAKYLRSHEPREVVFVEQHPDRSAACKREYEIKQFSKREKEVLIRQVEGDSA
ncbi:GIY-YIG nuclease family protein [Rhodohalobacter sp. 8-1]|uniref:GIY-YIG nuclease family protein n=1 Tax=Rhodohalobacter sp. 8-1 TaxID=3131972 RepID=UPI0030ECBD39